MAIINCKECGKEISDTAKICPNCGREYPQLEEQAYRRVIERNKKKEFWNKNWALKYFIIFIVVLTIIIFMMLTGIGI